MPAGAAAERQHQPVGRRLGTSARNESRHAVQLQAGLRERPGAQAVPVHGRRRAVEAGLQDAAGCMHFHHGVAAAQHDIAAIGAEVQVARPAAVQVAGPQVARLGVEDLQLRRPQTALPPGLWRGDVLQDHERPPVGRVQRHAQHMTIEVGLVRRPGHVAEQQPLQLKGLRVPHADAGVTSADDPALVRADDQLADGTCVRTGVQLEEGIWLRVCNHRLALSEWLWAGSPGVRTTEGTTA